MKKILITFFLIFLIKLSYGQTHSIVGAWFWSDSTKKTSIFFKADGNLSMHSGAKGDVILAKNLKNGKYVLTNNLLVITWTDNHVEKDKLEFLNKNSFQITIADSTNKSKKSDYVFKRVVDEEVIEEKQQ